MDLLELPPPPPPPPPPPNKIFFFLEPWSYMHHWANGKQIEIAEFIQLYDMVLLKLCSWFLISNAITLIPEWCLASQIQILTLSDKFCSNSYKPIIEVCMWFINPETWGRSPSGVGLWITIPDLQYNYFIARW